MFNDTSRGRNELLMLNTFSGLTLSPFSKAKAGDLMSGLFLIRNTARVEGRHKTN